MYESLLDALRRGAADEALSAARDAVTTQPQDPMAHRLLGAALHLGGDNAGALSAVDAALALTPDDASLHVERAGLLLGARNLSDAEAALARAIGLDPNQFPAYVMQGQLALGRGDTDEADRVARTAARIAPQHPQVAAIQGMVALRRGDADRALAILAPASKIAPDEASLRNALGMAYIAKGHFAFAEQCFRQQLEKQPDSVALRGLIADLVRRQGRFADAADEAAPLLERADVAPGTQRVVGELELEAGRTDRALPLLKAAFAAMPRDRRTLEALVEAWRRNADLDDARATLDPVLDANADEDNLWRARLLFEPYAGPAALALVERWLAARPDHVPALQARAAIHDHLGETEAADAIAYRIATLEPGDTQAEIRIVDRLMQKDPPAAVARVNGLLARAKDPRATRLLRHLLGRCLDAAGDTAQAVATWSALHAEVVDQRLPLPVVTAGQAELPELAPVADGAQGVLWIWGPPGSLVERATLPLAMPGSPLRTDRFGVEPPHDPLQRYGTAQELLEGRLDPAELVAQWRAALPSRGVEDGRIFDCLLWWDNALLHALRAHLPEAVLMLVVRDPRDMLLQWLALEQPHRFAFESPQAAARWLAATLAHVADLHEGNLFPHRLLKIDELAYDAEAMGRILAQGLGIQTLIPPTLGPAHFAPGHWRAYAAPLAEAFALLTPVAVRLGYPET